MQAFLQQHAADLVIGAAVLFLFWRIRLIRILLGFSAKFMLFLGPVVVVVIVGWIAVSIGAPRV